MNKNIRMENKVQQAKKLRLEVHLMLSILKIGPSRKLDVQIQLFIKPATLNKSQSDGQMMGANPSPSPIWMSMKSDLQEYLIHICQ